LHNEAGEVSIRDVGVESEDAIPSFLIKVSISECWSEKVEKSEKRLSVY
jgi:hypothetical protein